MSEETVAVVRGSYEAYVQGDFEAALGAYSDDTEWDDTRVRPEGGVHHGPEAVSERTRTWRGTFSDYTFEIEDVIDAGAHVVVSYRDRGRGKSSGVQVENHWGLVVTVEAGRITRTVFYPSLPEALRATGLAE